MQRIEEYNQLLEDSKEVLRKDTTLWKGFLKFATQFTHYQFFDQILIYVQNPKATACATFDQWKKIGRYVRKGEHSIVLLDETGKRGKLRHIFDVTATGPDQEFEYRPKPILPEQREELARKLNAAYSRENSAYAADSARWDGDLEHTLSQIALSMTQEYYNLSPDQAAAQSESTEIPAYYIATATSAMYLLLEKYGFSQEAESLDFSCMNQLDMETFSGVGNAASAILSWTARLVRTVQREQVRERGNEHERNDNGRYSETDHISSGGRFPGSEHRTPGERRESAGVTEVRDDAEKLSEGEQPSGIRESGSEWNTVSGDGEGGRSSGSDQGTGITATAQGRGSDRGTETERSAQMGGTDGILPPSGGGNYSDGTGVQLTLSDYFEIRPTDRENVSDSDTPKAEHEEIQIEQTEQAAGETPAAFVIPESELVRILQRGSGFEGGKIRIAAFYQKESDAAKRAAFLKEEYGIGGWTFQFEEGVTGWVDWNARGLSIKKFHDEDNSVVKLSWLQVEKRIGQLIENDQYFLESEKEDEIIQISIIDGLGNVLINELVHPYWKKSWSEAARVNGITPDRVANAPYPHELIPKVKGIFAAADLLVAYNNQFDLNFLEEWGIQAIGKKQFDVMLAFAREYGEWNDFFCDYKWQKLGTAAAYYGYHFRAHDSLEDVRATLYIFDQMQHSNKRELFEDYFWEDSEDEFDEEEEW